MQPVAIRTRVAIATASALLAWAATAGAAEVTVGIRIGSPAPPPPPVVAVPPPLVVVPGTPVYHVPSASYTLFSYGGRYYSVHDGIWFVAVTGGPWSVIALEHVPVHVRQVPPTFYKVPPGHAKKQAGPPPWAANGRGKHKKKDD